MFSHLDHIIFDYLDKLEHKFLHENISEEENTQSYSADNYSPSSKLNATTSYIISSLVTETKSSPSKFEVERPLSCEHKSLASSPK
jgi:hypothetical protein